MPPIRGQHLIGKIIGPCVLESVLGYGGSSAVYLAQQLNSDHKVAVKVFQPRSTMDVQMRKDFYRRFLREAEAASKLDHPHILPIYSYGEQDGLPYIVMPYMTGGTLTEYIHTHGPLSLQEAQWYLEQIASALDYAHEHGCVHCDVKPANILLDSEGRVMLSDFGIARVSQDNAADPKTAKSPEALMGTPDYISPEQALGRQLDGRSDVYSLGITLFYLLTSQLPFRADTTIALALLHVHEPPPALSQRRSDVTPLIDRVLRKALAKKPEDRYQTAGQFSSAFTDAIEAAEQPTVEGRHLFVRPQRGDAGLAAHPAVASLLRRTALFRERKKPSRLLVVSLCLLCVLTIGGLIGTALAVHSAHPAQTQTTTPNTNANALVNPSVVNDLFTDRSQWLISRTAYFEQNQPDYHVSSPSSSGVALVLYQARSFADFDVSLTIREVQGAADGQEYYGLVFRCSDDLAHYYLFEIGPADHGQYAFFRFDQGNWSTITNGDVPDFHSGPGQSNTMTISAHMNSFTFKVNNVTLGKMLSDSHTALRSGYLGVYVEDRAEVIFSQLHVTPSTP